MQAMRGWAARYASWMGFLGLFGAAQGAVAGDYDGSPQVAEFVGEMTRDYGFAGEQLMDVFREAERKQSILDAISRPAERVKQWKEYRPMFLTDARVARGVDFWREHEAVLARAEKEYGVPAQVIVSIIGVETFYGRNTGNYRVIDALSTLGFDYPPRAEFFRKELREFLLLAREEQVDPLSLKGSYAGAMGLPQFMPSSYRKWAVDSDGDNHRNIWGSIPDVAASVANYMKAHGWQSGGKVVVPVSLSITPELQAVIDEKTELKYSVGQLRKMGVTPMQTVADHERAILFRLETSPGVYEYFIGLHNFYTIWQYNHSRMYVTAVRDIANGVGAGGL